MDPFTNLKKHADSDDVINTVESAIDHVFDAIYHDYRPKIGFQAGMTKEATEYATKKVEFKRNVVKNLYLEVFSNDLANSKENGDTEDDCPMWETEKEDSPRPR